MVPSLSARNLQTIKIGKDFMFSHGYIKNDFDVDAWARPEFLEKAAEEVLKEEWVRRSWSKLPAGRRARGRRHAARIDVTQPGGPASARRGRPVCIEPKHRIMPGPQARPRTRETPMAKTAVDLVTEARVGLENISPADAQTELAVGQGSGCSTSGSPSSGRSTSREPFRFRGACSSSQPIPPARATRPSLIRRGA